MYIKNNILYKSLVSSYSLLPVKLKRKAKWVLVTLFLNSIIDLLGIAAIFPLFTVLIQDDFLESGGWLKDIYDFFGFGSSDSFVIFLSLIVLFIVVFKNVVYIISKRYQAGFAYQLYEYYTTGMMDITYRKGYGYLSAQNSNETLRNLSHVPRMYGLSMVIPLLSIVNEAMILLIVLSILVTLYSYVVLAIIVVLFPLIFLFYRAVKRRIQALEEELNDLVPENTRAIFDILFGYQDIRTSGRYIFFRNEFRRTVKRERRARTRLSVYNEMPVKIVEIGVVMAILLVMLFSFFYIDSVDERVVLFGVFGLAAFRIMPSLNKVVIAIVQIKGKEYTLAVLDTLKNEGVGMEDERPADPLPFEKSIELKDVHFSYEPEKPNLVAVNATIKKGDFIGVVGESGAGKTTLVNLLLRFIHEQSGEIIVDGTPLNQENERSWHRIIGYVKQDVFIIDDTLMANIAFGEPNPDEARVRRAIELAELDGFISDLPEGLKTRIGERGALISGGQRQRIGIARAVYRNPEVLILDESTSSLDPDTENAFIDTIKRLVDNEGTTIIFITHKLQSLRYCNEIFRIAKGQLTQESKHE